MALTSSEQTSDLRKFSWEESLKSDGETGIGQKATVKLNGVTLLDNLQDSQVYDNSTPSLLNMGEFPNEREAVCRFKSPLGFS